MLPFSLASNCRSFVLVGLLFLLFFHLSKNLHAASATWNIDADGDWNVNGNWTPNTGFPNATTDDALIQGVTAARSIDLKQSIDLRTITFNNDGGQITLTNSNGNALRLNLEGTNLIFNSDGQLEQKVPILLVARTNVWIGNGSSAFEARANGISEANNGSMLVIDGSGGWTFRINSTNLQVSTLVLRSGDNQFNWSPNANIFNTVSNIVIEGGLIRSLSGLNRTIASAWTVAGNYSIASNGTISNTGPVDLGSSVRTISINATTNFISGIIFGTGGLTKAGSGAIILSGTNTYSGNTRVNSGTLVADSASAFGATGNINAAGGTLLFNTGFTNTGATITLSGGEIKEVDKSISLGAMTLTGNSSITLNSGGSSGGFRFLSGTNTSGSTLTIYGWDYNSATDSGSDDLIFFTTTSFQSASFLNNVTFFGTGGGARILSSGELVPITPEPNTILTSLILLASLLKFRRKFKIASI